MSIEGFLLMNFLMDTILIMTAMRSAGFCHGKRAMLGGAIGAVYALTAATTGGLFASKPMQFLVLLMMLWMVGGRRCIRLSIVAAAVLAAFLSAGVFVYAKPLRAGAAGILGAIAICAVLLYAAQERRRLQLRQQRVRIRIMLGGKTEEIEALIDTGNCLREPFSGLPVLIAEQKRMAGLEQLRCMPLRQIPYGGLGGSGVLSAFRPDEVQYQLEEKWMRGPAVWVALYPGRIAGNVQALAPPEFAMTDRVQ